MKPSRFVIQICERISKELKLNSEHGWFCFHAHAFITLVLICFMFSNNANAMDVCTLKVAEVVSVQGIIELRRTQAAFWTPVELGS